MTELLRNEPPTEADRVFWQLSCEYATELERAIHEHVRTPSSTASALELLKNRINGGMNSLWVLRKYAPHDFGFDGMMVLRGMYDAHLQALYVAANPGVSEARALLFLEYQWVERTRMLELLHSNSTSLARALRSDPRRAEETARTSAEYQRVCAHYHLGRSLKIRKNWYTGNLRMLAKEPGVDLETEYEILQRQLSGAVHSSPLSLLSGPLIRGENLIELGWRLVFRVLGRIAAVHGVPLAPRQHELLSDAERNFFDDPSQGTADR